MIKLRVILFLIFFSLSSNLASQMSQNRIEGSNFASKSSDKAWEYAQKVSSKELEPSSGHPEKINQDDLYKKVRDQEIPKSEIRDFLLSQDVQINERDNKNINDQEYYFKRSEQITQAKEDAEPKDEIEGIEEHIEICRQSGEPMLLSVTRSLDVQVVGLPKQKLKICKGHQRDYNNFGDENEAKKIKKFRHKLSNDSTVTEFKEYPHDIFYYRFTWYHHDNIDKCDHYNSKKISPETFEEKDEMWIYDSPDQWELSKSPDCQLIEQECLEKGQKIINGKTVDRQCWKERISFLYHFPNHRECDFLKNRNCQEMSRSCLKSGPFGCALWEISYKCFDKVLRTSSTNSNEIFGLEEEIWHEEQNPNKSFSQVATKLAVFSEIKKEIEATETPDSSRIKLFKGQKMACSKNVAESVMYDCCFSYAGFAKKIGLSKCNADEISLADRRERGLCHYIGSYEEKVLDLWKSSDNHVFCCYPSKLARVLQEESHRQLKISWGTAKEPQCDGLSFNHIEKLDFSKMDFREVLDDMPKKMPDDFSEKIERFQNRLRDDISQQEVNK